MVELIAIVAILGVLVMIITPRMTWMEPPKRILQRAFIEAVDMARDGVSIRFRVDKIDNVGTIIPEILVKEKANEFDMKGESTWKAFEMRWQPTGNGWTFEPEIIYFSQDGICTPAKISWGTSPYDERYLLTVTGYLVENNRF
jgi:hypothetical protein